MSSFEKKSNHSLQSLQLLQRNTDSQSVRSFQWMSLCVSQVSGLDRREENSKNFRNFIIQNRLLFGVLFTKCYVGLNSTHILLTLFNWIFTRLSYKRQMNAIIDSFEFRIGDLLLIKHFLSEKYFRSLMITRSESFIEKYFPKKFIRENLSLM